jgi:glutathionylspermidine synthase
VENLAAEVWEAVRDQDQVNMSKEFFDSIGFAYSQHHNQTYALLDSISFQDLGLNIDLDKYKQLNSELAQVIDEAQLKVIRNQKLAFDLAYPEKSLEILGVDTGNLCCMRLGYVVDTSGNPKLIEVNSQTPSFWWECEKGREQVLQQLGKKTDRLEIQSFENMLRFGLKQCAQKLGRPVSLLRVGFVTCDSLEDVFQMEFVNQQIKKFGLVFETEVLTINRLDVGQNNRFFSLNTEEEIDMLFLWYPLEWLCEETFADGTLVVDCLKTSLEQKKLAVFNGVESFAAQNKNLFGFITEFWDTLEAKDLDTNFVPTYYTLEDLKKDLGLVSYIGKPIFGRQGLGVIGQDNFGNIEGDLSDSYYNNQYYVYQPFVESKSLMYQGLSYHYTLEQWVYKTAENQWESGGLGLRITPKQVVDDLSQWLSVEIK